MRYKKFHIEKYKGVKNSAISIIQAPVPIIGINESGKSSVLESIAHFDFRNDDIASTKGWKFLNRYNPTESEFKVSAEIELNPEKLKVMLESFSEEERAILIGNLANLSSTIVDRIFRKNGEPSKNYRIAEIEDELHQRFCEKLINLLPRIIYFDNFLENPFPNYVEMPDNYHTDSNLPLNENQKIIERMFIQSGYSLKDIFNSQDQNEQSTCLSEVNKYLNKMLIENWEKMRLKPGDLDVNSIKAIDIELQLSNTLVNTVNIKVKERFKLDGQRDFEATLDLNERSLGFRWFLNFSMKKVFGTEGEEQVIYLFDEPGSFLHNSAQRILLDALKELALKHPVIYTTHSEFLLDPEKININNIRIVEKEKREIIVIPYGEMQIEKNQGALSALQNALRLNVSSLHTYGQKIIVTEGLIDFYFWRLLSSEFMFLPGQGAGSNQYLISLAIGTSQKYVALFDGDSAGDDAIIKYKKIFNDEEAHNWIQYKDSHGKPIKLEKIFSKNDQDRLKKLMGVSDMKKALTMLYYSDSKSEFLNILDTETVLNISFNLGIILEKLDLSQNTKLNYSLAVG